MFRKIVDVIKEVFWIKKSKKKVTTKKRPTAKKKSAVKPKIKAVKKSVIAKVPKVKVVLIDPRLTKIGVITHYFERIKVAVIQVNVGSVLIGDKIHIIGARTKFIQKVWSMQIDKQDVKVAKKGDDIGLKLDKPVVVGDFVYK